MDYTKHKSTILAIIGVGFIGYLYTKYNDKKYKDDNIENYKIIQNYLINSVTLDNKNKPILWIHIPYKLNSRKWESFGSRNTYNLNEPYLQLTVKTIIEKCKKSFYICLIDDDSFRDILPEWNVDMSRISDPILSKLRITGMMKILYKYGGLFIPPTFVCLKNLKTFYDEGTNKKKPFCVEYISRNSSSSIVDYFPNTLSLGALKNDKTIQKLIQYLEGLISRDCTNESLFDGNIERQLFKLVQDKKMNMLPANLIGAKTADDKYITIEDMMETNGLKITKNAYGVYIPHDEILHRKSYEWFANISHDEIINSELNICRVIQSSLPDVEESKEAVISM